MLKHLFSLASLVPLLQGNLRALLIGTLLLLATTLPGGPAFGGEVVTAGIFRNFPPLFYLDPGEKPRGLGVDLLDELSKRAGFKVRFKVYENGGPLLGDLKNGQVDLISTTGITPPVFQG